MVKIKKVFLIEFFNIKNVSVPLDSVLVPGPTTKGQVALNHGRGSIYADCVIINVVLIIFVPCSLTRKKIR